MRVVIISDSHGNKEGVDRIFQNLQFDYLFFVGDGLGDIGNYSYLDNVKCVAGNCDLFSLEPIERIVNIENKDIFLTHGHKYKVKLTLNNLIQEANERGVAVVLYGHTHIRKIEKINDIYFVNPGSFSKIKDGQSSGLIMNIDKNGINFEEFKV